MNRVEDLFTKGAGGAKYAEAKGRWCLAVRRHGWQSSISGVLSPLDTVGAVEAEPLRADAARNREALTPGGVTERRPLRFFPRFARAAPPRGGERHGDDDEV